MNVSHRPIRFDRVLFVLVVLLLAGTVAKAGTPPKNLRLTMSGDSFRVEKANPMSEIILVGHEISSSGYSPVYRRVYREATTDAAGVASIDLGRPVADVSFWLAFDVSTGAYGALTARGQKLRDGELPSNRLKKDSGGKLKRLELPLDYVYILVVRPGTGAWELVAGDGAEGDTDGNLNGVISIDSPKMRSRKKAPAMDAYEDGDVLVVFVPRQNGFLITEVKK